MQTPETRPRPQRVAHITEQQHEYVFVRLFILQSRDAEKLYKLHARRTLAAYADAIWSGYWEVQKDAKRLAEKAREHGQLLMCWDGTRCTKVTEVTE